MQKFVFCSGFGFNHNFWKHLISFFENKQYLYLDDNLNVDGDLIGIGHSLGMVKLINSGIKFQRMIGLNAFTNFLGNNEKLRRRRMHELNMFESELMRNPQLTMQKFYERCGYLSNSNEIKNLNLLDLKFLKMSVIASENTLIITSDNDTIVPLELIQDNFSDNQIKIIKNAKHMLGYTEAAIVYKEIMNFLE